MALLGLQAALLAACHGSNHQLESVHSATDWELACIELEPGVNEDLSEIHAQLNPILTDPRGWDSRSRITISLTQTECEHVVDRDMYRIEYHVYPSGGNPCGVPCAWFWDDEEAGRHSVHVDYDKGHVGITVDELVVYGMPKFHPLAHVINHETGHIFGLADPIDNPVGVGPDRCTWPLNGQEQWIESIMHNPYRCEGFVPEGPGLPVPWNMSHPSSHDLNSVDQIGKWDWPP